MTLLRPACVDSAPDERLDIGCVAAAGSFEAVHGVDGVTIETCPPAFALAFFFLRLLHGLQRIGTVPAIDYDAYLGALNQGS